MRLSLMAAFAVLTLIAVSVSAQGPCLTQSVDNVNVTAGNSVSCNTGGLHADNSYWRAYSQAEVPFAANFEIRQVKVGVETSMAGNSLAQPAQIRIYADPTPGNPAPMAGLNLLHTENITIPDGVVNSVLCFVLSTPVFFNNNGDDLVIELFTPDGQMAGNSFFMGSNAAGETAPSYLSAMACGIPEPTPTGTIGFPTMNIILDVCINPVNVVRLYPGTPDDLATKYSVNGGMFTVVGPGTDRVCLNQGDCIEICHCSPNGTFVGTGPMTVFGSTRPTGAPFPSPFPGLHVFQPTAFLIIGSTVNGNPLQMPANGACYKFTYFGGLGGLSTVIQCIVQDGMNASNMIFASTNGLELKFQ